MITPPTLDDVAHAAGVSTATVSRCLNMPDKVTEKTRKRVMQAVEQLGYTPNFGARMMASNRSYTIGAIVPTLENAIFAKGLQAFQETLHAKGYTLLVSSTAYNPETEAEQVRALAARSVDGLLLIGYARKPALYEYLDQQKIPAVLAWSFSNESARATVGFDNRAAMRMLAEKVLAYGHRRIAVISGITKGNDRAAQRLIGIRDAVQNAGLSEANVSVVQTSYEIENGARAFAGLMQAAEQPTAVICGNDVLAAGALSQARSMGLHVPDDVSITGFDDIEIARIVTPQLTTVRVPHREMGERAAKALVEMIETNSAGQPLELKSEIVMRDSLGRI